MPQTGSRSKVSPHVPSALLTSLFFRLAQMRVNQFEQLVVHRLGFLLPAAAQGFRGAMAEVIAHEVARDTAQRFLHTGDLGDNVRAVAVVFDHFLQARIWPSMRRSRWRLAALISGSTAAALRAPVSHAQAALA